MFNKPTDTSHVLNKPDTPVTRARRELLTKIGELRGSTAVLFVTSDRDGMSARITHDCVDQFVKHLDGLGDSKKVSLVLHTRGGDTLAGWGIANLIRQYADDVEVLVPSRAHSAGTLMGLGANRLVMTRNATLGPIDPSVQGPLNPPIPGAPPDSTMNVSAEAVNGYVAFARQVTDGDGMGDVMLDLAKQIHPLVLGDVYRARQQIRDLAGRLLIHQIGDADKTAILDFLCGDSGSHDYSIFRDEARDRLNLVVEDTDETLTKLLKDLHANYAGQMKFAEPFLPDAVLGSKQQMTYTCDRVLVESPAAGADCYRTAGIISRQTVQGPDGAQQSRFGNQSLVEGWEHFG
ncbi:MAG: ATP-dependent Clp protease proteolytic subunit [Planctomycetota bacterium]